MVYFLLESFSLVHHAIFSFLVLLLSFPSCCFVRVIFHCKFAILKILLFNPLHFRQRLAVFVIVVPSFKKCFAPAMLGLASFLQHLLGLVLHSLPFGSSTFGTTVKILVDEVTWNSQSVEILLVQLFWYFCDGVTHLPHEQYTLPISRSKLQSGQCFWEHVSQSSKISALPKSVINFYDSSLNVLIFSVLCNSCGKDSLFG